MDYSNISDEEIAIRFEILIQRNYRKGISRGYPVDSNIELGAQFVVTDFVRSERMRFAKDLRDFFQLKNIRLLAWDEMEVPFSNVHVSDRIIRFDSETFWGKTKMILEVHIKDMKAIPESLLFIDLQIYNSCLKKSKLGAEDFKNQFIYILNGFLNVFNPWTRGAGLKSIEIDDACKDGGRKSYFTAIENLKFDDTRLSRIALNFLSENFSVKDASAKTNTEKAISSASSTETFATPDLCHVTQPSIPYNDDPDNNTSIEPNDFNDFGGGNFGGAGAGSEY